MDALHRRPLHHPGQNKTKESDMLHDIQPPRRFPKLKTNRFTTKKALLWGGVVAGLLGGLWFGATGSNRQASNEEQAARTSSEQTRAIAQKTVKGVIQPGDTVTSLFADIFTPQQIHILNQATKPVFPLSRLTAGQSYALRLVDGKFISFTYDIDREDQLVVCREGDSFVARKIPIEYEVITDLVTGVIDSSLFGSIVQSGENEVLAISLADIFAWDIDFIRDIQPGDAFEALVEKRFREGTPAGYGRILAARFTNQGQPYSAYLFKDGNQPAAYYDENGRSLRKAFLKAPLSFSRISSGFNMRRRHPITKKVRPHPAIDYAAPTGTPIKTVGDGTVTFAAFKRYNGNCVKVRHPGGWETMYNHMSRFGRGIKRGVKVRQGQVIGYVGTTGLSTGPHLDFRMYKNGVALNPLKIKTPPSAPVSAQHLPDFKRTVAQLTARLEGSQPVQTAALVGNHNSGLEADSLRTN
jgi:murein DD-endopeptidase MepM/ murein hydrolase activator NlpD